MASKFFKHLEKVIASKSSEDWVQDKVEQRMVILTLGKGVWLSVVYNDMGDDSYSNIDYIEINENGQKQLVSDDDMEMLHHVGII